MKFRLHDGLELYYETHGNAASTKTIVFLNGLTQGTVAWYGVYPGLTANHQIILLDLIGQGKSDAGKTHRSFDEHAKDVTSLIKKVVREKVILVGISYGGAVAQHMLVNHPEVVSAAVLVSTFAHKTLQFNMIGQAWANALNMGGYSLMFDVMMPYVLGKDYFKNPIISLEELKKARLANDLKKENILKLMKATEERKDYREDLKKVNKPVLIIHGEQDLLIPVADAEEMHKSIKNSEIKIIKKAGHTLNLEAMSELTSLIKAFSETV